MQVLCSLEQLITKLGSGSVFLPRAPADVQWSHFQSQHNAQLHSALYLPINSTVSAGKCYFLATSLASRLLVHCSCQQKASFAPPQSFQLEYSLGTWTANLRTKPVPLISVGKWPTAAAGTKLAILAAEEETQHALSDWYRYCVPPRLGKTHLSQNRRTLKLNANLEEPTFFNAIWVVNHIR